MTNGLAPRWASAPASTIRAVLAERGMSVEDLAGSLNVSPAVALELVGGRVSISVDLASRLSAAIGASTRFWLTREAEFVEDRLRVLAADWSNGLPVAQMRQFGWIEGPRTWREQTKACLDFFGVEDFEEWREQYASQVTSAHYRKSPTFENDETATLVWFRAAERAVEGRFNLPPFNPQRLSLLVPNLKRLTRKPDPAQFIPELQRLCAEVGLQVGVVRAPTGCRASGATRWIGATPIVQLSARHLSDDHFWYTFFHELGHVLLHGAKRTPFIDLDASAGDESDPLEDEADRFAQSVLIGDSPVEVRVSDPRDVVRAAARLGISPGLLVGQLQHSGRLGPDRLNSLKRRYRWETATLVAS